MSQKHTFFYELFTGKREIVLDRYNRIFIDRDGQYFAYILDYLRDGELFLPDDAAIKEMIYKELKFYGININPNPRK